MKRRRLIIGLVIIVVSFWFAATPLSAQTPHRPPQAAVKHYKNAKSHIQAGYLLKAEKALESAVKLDPEYVEAIGALALVYRRRGKMTSYRAMLRRAAEISSRQRKGLATTSEAPRKEVAQSKAKEYPKLGPDRVLLEFDSETRVRYSTKPRSCWSAYPLIIGALPDNVNVTNESLLKRIIKRGANLIREYCKSLPGRVPAFHGGRIRLYRGPESRGVLAVLSGFGFRKGRLRIGWTTNHALKKKQRAEERGLDYLNRGRYEDAVKVFKDAVLFNPNDAGMHYRLGVANLNIGNNKATLKEYNWLKERDPEMAKELNNQIQLKKKLVAEKAARETERRRLAAEREAARRREEQARRREEQARREAERKRIEARLKGHYISRTIEGFALGMPVDSAQNILKSKYGNEISIVSLFDAHSMREEKIPFLGKVDFKLCPEKGKCANVKAKRSAVFSSSTTRGFQLFFYRDKLLQIKVAPLASNDLIKSNINEKYGKSIRKTKIKRCDISLICLGEWGKWEALIWEDADTKLTFFPRLPYKYLDAEGKAVNFYLIYEDKALMNMMFDKATGIMRHEEERKEKERKTLPKGF